MEHKDLFFLIESAVQAVCGVAMLAFSALNVYRALRDAYHPAFTVGFLLMAVISVYLIVTCWREMRAAWRENKSETKSYND